MVMIEGDDLEGGGLLAASIPPPFDDFARKMIDLLFARFYNMGYTFRAGLHLQKNRNSVEGKVLFCLLAVINFLHHVVEGANMRLILLLSLFVTCPTVLQAEFVGAELPLEDGTPDGWSGVPVMYGNVLPAGESISTVRYYTADARFEAEDGVYHMVPLIVQQEDGSEEDGEGIFTVWEVGPAHTADGTGEQEFSWGSSAVPDDGNLYHPAALQWNDGFNNAAGGHIAFGQGGDGMHYFDIDTTDFIPDEDIGDIEPEMVLSDLTIHSSAFGGRYYQLNFETGSQADPGDFNADGLVDNVDMDLLSGEIRNGGQDAKFDVNSDGTVSDADRSSWVIDVKMTWFGDSDLNGLFDSSDFVLVFQEGLFETGGPAGWREGDWNGDGRFSSSDFVTAFQDGGFEAGPRVPAAALVPEPSTLIMVIFSAMTCLYMKRQRQL